MAAARAIGRFPRCIIALLLGACLAASADAKEEPLWEIGLGGGAVALTDYPGASSSHVYPVP